MMKSSEGFATVLLLSLLPLILAAGIALFFTFGFLKSDLAVLNVCRAKELELQNKAGRNLAKLLKLNPRALNLRIEEARAEKALASAVESGNPPAIAAAEAYLLSVQMRRQDLRIRQRALIDTADMWLSTGGAELPRDLQREWLQHHRGLSSWLENRFQIGRVSPAKLAVIPDMPDTAPVYLLRPDFAEAQAWKQSWSFRLATTGWSRRFLNFNGGFERSCTVSLYPEGEEWIARLKKDKFSSKVSL
jgi:hypothetical protein